MAKRKENRMFRRAATWQPPKALRPARPRFIEYGWAYWESAKALFCAMRSELDSYSAFPLVFLYRQAIELVLKGILIEHGWSRGIQREAIIGRKHNLVAQVSDIEAVARGAGLRISSELKRHVGQLNGIDPKSATFRFPESRQGKPTLTEKEAAFDVEQFVSTAEIVLEELKTLADEVDYALYEAILRDEGIYSE